MSPCLLVAMLAASLCTCSKPAAPVARRAATGPAVGDFAAFGGGGELRNVAPAIEAPPMKVRWTYHAGDAVKGAPVIVGEGAYVADESGDVTALELAPPSAPSAPATGKKRWTFHSEAGFEATPLVRGGVVYIGDLQGTFFAVDAVTGKQLWTLNAQSAIYAGANGDGERIIFGTDSGLILCLDGTGKKLWTAQADGRINAPPAIREGLAAFSSCDGNLRVLRMEDGKEMFKTELGNLAPGSACASEKCFFVGTDQGHVLAVSNKDGKVLWNFDKIEESAMVYASPALAEDTLVIGARDSKVYGLNAGDGTVKWTFTTGADVDASPVISAGRVYVASKDRRLYVLNLADGKQLWTYETARPVVAPVAIGRGVLVMGDSGGTVYCLEPE